MSEIDKSPADLPLKFVSGDDFSLNIAFAEAITGDTFRAAIIIPDLKTKTYSIASLFTVTATPGAGSGVVNILLTEVNTASLFGKYFWFFERTHGTETRTLISGDVEVIRKKA